MINEKRIPRNSQKGGGCHLNFIKIMLISIACIILIHL